MTYILADVDVVLANTFESELFLFDEDLNRVLHETLRHFQHFGRHCRREEHHLKILQFFRKMIF